MQMIMGQFGQTNNLVNSEIHVKELVSCAMDAGLSRLQQKYLAQTPAAFHLDSFGQMPEMTSPPKLWVFLISSYFRIFKICDILRFC